MDAGRWRQLVAHKAVLRVIGRDKFGKGSGEIKENDDNRADDGHAMAQKTPPHQLQIRSYINLLIYAAWRIVGYSFFFGQRILVGGVVIPPFLNRLHSFYLSRLYSAPAGNRSICRANRSGLPKDAS